MPKRCLPSIAAAFVLAASVSSAQPPAPRPVFEEFDVATIKPSDPKLVGRFLRMQSANRFVARNYTLKYMIGAAYNLTPRSISGGPAWSDSDRYEILALTPGEVKPNPDEQMTMLRKLLADRFKLAFHREPKTLPIYALTIAKDVMKLKKSDPAKDDAQPDLVNVVYPEHVSLPARNATMPQFTSMLQSPVLDRPVVDRTGLVGKYDFDLEWTPDETQFGGQLPRPAEPNRPGLFAALQQQLGLRMEATRGTIDTLVIDRAERPAEN